MGTPLPEGIVAVVKADCPTCQLVAPVLRELRAAGVIIDALRCAKVALDRGLGGPLLGPSAYFMKSPPVQYRDDEAREMVEAFAAGRETPRPSQQRSQ